MGISIYKIKKWYKMLSGQSISHVNQNVGKHYSKNEVIGYYNDLTEKVTKDNPEILVPQYYVENGEKKYFSIGIFQYGLGAYDLLIETGDKIYKDKVIACAEWAMDNQNQDGSWETFEHESKYNPFSSMAQGEATSLLLRGGLITQNDEYFNAAKKAIYYMIKPIEDNGTAKYENQGCVYFYEFPEKDLVLNGWIFSIWGLYDYCKYSKDEELLRLLDDALETLKGKLPEFDDGYWSKYDAGKNISSPFYHKLHIAQLKVMYDLFGDEIYKEYADKWQSYQDSFWKPKYAFLKKAFQKVFERS